MDFLAVVAIAGGGLGLVVFAAKATSSSSIWSLVIAVLIIGFCVGLFSSAILQSEITAGSIVVGAVVGILLLPSALFMRRVGFREP